MHKISIVLPKRWVLSSLNNNAIVFLISGLLINLGNSTCSFFTHIEVLICLHALHNQPSTRTAHVLEIASCLVGFLQSMLYLQADSIFIRKGFSQTMVLAHKAFICLKTGTYIGQNGLEFVILFPLPVEYLDCFQLYEDHIVVKDPWLVKVGRREGLALPIEYQELANGPGQVLDTGH